LLIDYFKHFGIRFNCLSEEKFFTRELKLDNLRFLKNLNSVEGLVLEDPVDLAEMKQLLYAILHVQVNVFSKKTARMILQLKNEVAH
jgi:hypothetical protein